MLRAPYVLVLEFDILEQRPQLIHWTSKYQGVESPNLQGVSCQPRFECGLTFPTLCLIPEPWMGSWVQSTTGCFPELFFLQFFMAQVLVGWRTKIYEQLCFLTCTYAAGFYNNSNIKIMISFIETRIQDTNGKIIKYRWPG